MATVNPTTTLGQAPPPPSPDPKPASFVPPATAEPKVATFVPSGAGAGAGAVVVGVLVVAGVVGGLYFATRRTTPPMTVTMNGRRMQFTGQEVDGIRANLKATGRWVEL